MSKLCLAQDPEADSLLSEDPFALLIGMVLDQQFPLERAFAAPAELRRRLGGTLAVDQVAEMDPEILTEAFVRVPALHRFPAANAERVQKLARLIVEQYDGDAAAVWTTAKTGDALLRNVRALPGFGEQKAKIFVALLGKQLGVRPRGWRDACAPYGDKGTTMSVADITSAESLVTVRAWKAAKKAAAKQANS